MRSDNLSEMCVCVCERERERVRERERQRERERESVFVCVSVCVCHMTWRVKLIQTWDSVSDSPSHRHVVTWREMTGRVR